MNRIWKLLTVVALLAGATMNLSCDVNDYCLNCGRPGDGGLDDGGDGDADDGGGDDDAGDGGTCLPTGSEVCDGKDNDCDNATDEGVLPEVGSSCGNQVGECAGGVKVCTAGTIRCSKPPMAEACDLKDNDCDNMIDEGDPGGGAVCGTNTGECVAGAYRCTGGQITCQGFIGTVGGQTEICNNRDDDCDGMFDENLVLGPCVAGVDGPAEGDTGACVLGTRQCVGGTTQCVGAVFPTFEQCDNIDQNCNGPTADGYDTMTDPVNCGGCGNVCVLPNAFAGCAGGNCTIVACKPNFFNNNPSIADGCEFDCGHPFLGNETCNGVDDDCNGVVDDNLVAPVGICDNDGACSTGTTLTCNGAAGWRCNYTNPNVQKDVNGNIIPETRCDSDLVAGVQADNDCDGNIDEAQPTLGDLCDNGLVGDCRSTGAHVCNTANRDGQAVCVYSQVGPGMSPSESCDGRDNDCDNATDEGAAGGNLAGQEWITIPNLTPAVQMMKYEASRPDSSLTVPGTAQHTVCSRPDVLPWTNITYPSAVQACQSVGARLCTEAEWQTMCIPPISYPVSGPGSTAVTDFVFIEAEDFLTNTPIGPASQHWNKVKPLSFNGVTAMQVADNGFGVNNAANALAQSSRLDFRLNLLGSTNYRVWARMRSPVPAAAPSPHGVATPATQTTSPVADISTAVGDLVIVTTWTVGGSGIPTHTLQSANNFVELINRDQNDGSTDGKLSVAYKIATVAGNQSYQAYTTSGGTSYSGINVLKAGTYDLSTIFTASTDDDSNNPPNPPDSNANGTNAVFAIGAWHLSSAATVSVGPPNGFTESWEMSGSNAGELSVAIGSSANPGNFSDNVSPNNTASATVAIRLNTASSASNSVWMGLNPGLSAGAANGGNVATTANDQWQWVVGPQLTSGAAGDHIFSLYLRADGVYVDTIAISRQSTTSPTFDNSWAYETNPRTPQPQTCNVDDYDTDTVAPGDQDDVLPTESLAACYANKAVDAYDMSGNVKEWTAARSANQNPLRGGASNNEVSGSTCNLNFTLATDTFFFPNVGFRCCR